MSINHDVICGHSHRIYSLLPTLMCLSDRKNLGCETRETREATDPNKMSASIAMGGFGASLMT